MKPEIPPPEVVRPVREIEGAVIREPSQGRPIFASPGETFYFVMTLTPNFKGDVGFSLRHALEPDVQSMLRPTTPPSYFNQEYCHIVLQVAEDIVPGLYDLEVKTPEETYYSRRSVRVIEKFKSKFRFVHLSNMNVGDPTAPSFDEMLPSEINVLAPEFIVATGDYTEWSRVLDDATSWSRVLKYFEQFNAPVFMLCGSHDHEASFTKYIASGPMGTIDYGNYHGILLLDHPANPIDQDYTQIQWVDADLKRNKGKKMNFLVSNSDEMGLIDVWRERGNIGDFIKEHKVALYLSGGSTDWDFKEFAGKLEGLDDFQFVRTHQSSTCMRDRATGFSHYRVIDVDGDKLAYAYPNDCAAERLQHSIPSGRLRVYYDAPNNGTATRVGATVQNALNQRFDDARIWLRVAKESGRKPTIAPGRVVRIVDAGDHWGCEVAFDLPDKGAVRIMAAANARDIPSAPPVAAAVEGPSNWSFTPQKTDFGLAYFESDTAVSIKLTNETNAEVTCWPVVRVNGAQLHLDPEVV
ncbi:MAG TPA: hypothetical protein VNT79_15950, partial [Phycisphaerae bacterium]|nr:hypothetical protein [Phycisphaerae bacterium]